jgi:methionyl-tRNA synthetase
MDELNFSSWQKVDMRVALIENVENIEGADNLYKLEVDCGEKRTLVAGLKKYYNPDELVGKKCIVLANLEPKELRGIESRGMILAAVSKDRKKVVILQPEKDIPVGSRIF